VQKAKTERRDFGAFYYRMPNGESPSDVYDRLSSFFETMYRSWDTTSTERMENLNYVIVCHGITIAVFLMRLFKYSVDQFNNFQNFTNAEFCVLDRQANGRYTQEALYCVKQKETDGKWQGVQGPRTIASDAGRFDRPIRRHPPSEDTADMTRAVTANDSFAELTFQPGLRLGFRCSGTNRVEAVIRGTQSDALGVMPGWYFAEANGTPLAEGGAKETARKAKESGAPYAIKFRIPAPERLE